MQKKFTVDESRIERSVGHLPDDWSSISRFEHPSTHQRSLILLPHLLSKVSTDFASGDAFNNLLRIVHKYPLREDDYSKSDELSPLYQQVVAAAKKYLGPYSQVSVRFYTMRISLIQIPNFRYTTYGMANMK